MSRITKSIAEMVAFELTKKHREELDLIKSEFISIATEIVKDTIPKDVLNTFNKSREYFSTSTRSYAVGTGLDRWFTFLHDELPTNGNSIQLTNEQAELCVKLSDKINDKKHEIKKLRSEIEIAVFGLRTYNNVEKEFPEAFVLLPKQASTALTVDLKKIRCKLDKKNC